MINGTSARSMPWLLVALLVISGSFPAAEHRCAAQAAASPAPQVAEPNEPNAATAVANEAQEPNAATPASLVPADTSAATTDVTIEQVEKKKAQTAESPDLSEDIKAKLGEIYDKTILPLCPMK